jgi:hypothetical protein
MCAPASFRQEKVFLVLCGGKELQGKVLTSSMCGEAQEAQNQAKELVKSDFSPTCVIAIHRHV